MIPRTTLLPTTRRRRLAAALGTILLVALPLSGCGGGDSPSLRDALDIADGEGSIDTDGDGKDDLSVDRDGDEVKVESSDGSLSVGDELPADFPTDDVPLIEGTIQQGTTYSAGESVGWSVGVLHDAPVPATLERVAAEFTDAGFEELNRFSADDGAVLGVMREDYTVQVSFADQDDGTLVVYTVARSAATP